MLKFYGDKENAQNPLNLKIILSEKCFLDYIIFY
jgi:hypothetical protein